MIPKCMDTPTIYMNICIELFISHGGARTRALLCHNLERYGYCPDNSV